MVTKDNAYVGMKVVRGRDWSKSDNYIPDYINDKKVIGTIIEINESYATVKWSKLITRLHRIGAACRYELYIAPSKSTDDYSIF